MISLARTVQQQRCIMLLKGEIVSMGNVFLEFCAPVSETGQGVLHGWYIEGHRNVQTHVQNVQSKFSNYPARQQKTLRRYVVGYV